jgi:hypothetical protein
VDQFQIVYSNASKIDIYYGTVKTIVMNPKKRFHESCTHVEIILANLLIVSGFVVSVSSYFIAHDSCLSVTHTYWDGIWSCIIGSESCTESLAQSLHLSATFVKYFRRGSLPCHQD